MLMPSAARKLTMSDDLRTAQLPLPRVFVLRTMIRVSRVKRGATLSAVQHSGPPASGRAPRPKAPGRPCKRPSDVIRLDMDADSGFARKRPVELTKTFTRRSYNEVEKTAMVMRWTRPDSIFVPE